MDSAFIPKDPAFGLNRPTFFNSNALKWSKSRGLCFDFNQIIMSNYGFKNPQASIC